MVKKKTLEEKVAGTVLQESREIDINGRKYAVCPIMAGTLIRISALISQLPETKDDMSYEELLKWALCKAEYLDLFAEIVAVGVLNRKNLEPVYARHNRLYFWKKPAMLFLGAKELKEEILYSQSPKQICTLIMDLIGRSELADFFGVMVSLGGVNLLKETKMNETTVSGPLSEEL